MKSKIRTMSAFAIIALSALLCSAEEPRPCRNVSFKPLAAGMMLYGDTTCIGEKRPFAKDPTVIRHNGRYLMYYSVHSPDPARRPAGQKHTGWRGAIAESTDLVNWRRIGDLAPEGAIVTGPGVAPCVKKIDGKIHMFAQSKPGRRGRNDLLWHATSEDGVHFKYAGSAPMFKPANKWSIDRAIDAEVYRVGDRLMLIYATREKPTEKKQFLGMAWAPYASDWSAGKWTELSTGKPFLSPDLPWEMNCIEAPTVIKHKGIWYMFYAGAFNHERQQIGMAWSADGVNFKRWSDKPVLPHGPEGSWNAWESGHPGVFQDDDGRIYLFFQGKSTLRGDYRLSCLEVVFED